MKIIGKIQSYYGGLLVKNENDKFYWALEDYAHLKWEEISEALYKELLIHGWKEFDYD